MSEQIVGEVVELVARGESIAPLPEGAQAIWWRVYDDTLAKWGNPDKAVTVANRALEPWLMNKDLNSVSCEKKRRRREEKA